MDKTTAQTLGVAAAVALVLVVLFTFPSSAPAPTNRHLERSLAFQYAKQGASYANGSKVVSFSRCRPEGDGWHCRLRVNVAIINDPVLEYVVPKYDDCYQARAVVDSMADDVFAPAKLSNCS